VGSVFSPYYALARKLGGGVAEAENFCALNVALYGKAGKRWAMTERGRNSCSRDKNEFVIGPSYITWDGDSLHIQINEISTPWLFTIASPFYPPMAVNLLLGTARESD
jgi:carotenoid 1,2-hydratase